MALNDAMVQALLVATVGDVDPATGAPTTAATGLVAQQMPALWALYADYAALHPALQRLYAHRHALDLVIGVLRAHYDFSDAAQVSAKESQMVQAAERQRADVQAELTLLESRVQAAGSPTVGEITRQAPISPPLRIPAIGPLDANDPRLAGSPYYPGRTDGTWGAR